MDQKNNQQAQHGHGGGFLLGVIVGVIVTLLFTTKRGREILKEMTEKGIEKFSDLEKVMKDVEEKGFKEEIDDDDYIPTSPAPEPKPQPAVTVAVEKKEVVEVKEVSPTAVAHAVKEAKKESKEPEPKKEAEAKPVEKKAEPVKEEKVEVKKEEKSSRGKRWFRGLRKKS